MMQEFIFIYGTLRKPIGKSILKVVNPHWLFIDHAFVYAKLYEVNGYPGAIESDNDCDIVYGELYQIINHDILLSLLDKYEECSEDFPKPHEYIRKKINVLLQHSDLVFSAWIYLYNYNVSQLLQITSGNYLQYIENSNILTNKDDLIS